MKITLSIILFLSFTQSAISMMYKDLVSIKETDLFGDDNCSILYRALEKRNHSILGEAQRRGLIDCKINIWGVTWY